MSKITYEDKVGIEPKTVRINQVQDVDMNLVKQVVNENDTCETSQNFPVLGDKTSAGRRYGEFDTPMTGTIPLDNTGAQEGGTAVVIWTGSSNPTISGAIVQNISGTITQQGVYSIYFHFLNGRWNVLIFNPSGTAPPQVFGCTDPTASNYNPLATVNDGSCVYGGAETAPVIEVNNPPYTLAFEIANLIESPAGAYKTTSASSYSGIGVSTQGFTGDFDFEVELDDTTYDCTSEMIGVDLTGVNIGYQVGTKWDFGIYNQNGTSDLKLIIAGIPNIVPDNPVTIAFAPNNKLRLVRVSNNLKAYYNAVEVHDFGAYAGEVFVHISANSVDRYVLNPIVTI